LDTHIWLWGLIQPRRLRPSVLARLHSPETERWLSPISLWEVIVLTEKRRIELPRSVEDLVVEARTHQGIRFAPVTTEVVLAMRGLSLPHRDPADRFLAATAVAYGLTLVTADARLLRVPGLKTMRA
jgi:PIN domain nuclease of toxin-antitoxin system